ncbi:hypothetical protein ACFYW9_41145 [Streptomyces sp. NPDC002698]|uniref:hypothetical protein n=1 Tax=Streptomyces sp. NPDC002698 TaxID=3364660 RepID=UPI0036AFE2B2
MRTARRAVLDAGVVPLIITPSGGVLGPDGEPVSVQRTFADVRSTEFDALLLALAPAVGADSHGARVSKADDDVAVAAGIDPRVPLMQASRALSTGHRLLATGLESMRCQRGGRKEKRGRGVFPAGPASGWC